MHILILLSKGQDTYNTKTSKNVFKIVLTSAKELCQRKHLIFQNFRDNG